jgi:ribosomal protein S18 acetylase RimI-like enzyme
MIYRPYTSEDFDQLYVLEELCFEPPFRFGRWTMRALVQRPYAATWIAEEDGKMAGFAIVEWTVRKRETTAYVQTIEVAPEFRRRGLGLGLLSRVEESAKLAGAASIWLHVEAENIGAIQLYEALGYGCRGRKDNFYPLGRAGLIYMKRLDSVSSSNPLALSNKA